MLNALNQKLIKAIRNHLKTGYYTNAPLCEAVIEGITHGKIQINCMRDEWYRYEDLAGDCFNPKVNTDIEPKELARQERNFKQRVRRQGVWTFYSEYWTGRAWERFYLQHNMIGGFVGEDFLGSGYELQIMEVALEAYNQQTLGDDGFVIDPYRGVA